MIILQLYGILFKIMAKSSDSLKTVEETLNIEFQKPLDQINTDILLECFEADPTKIALELNNISNICGFLEKYGNDEDIKNMINVYVIIIRNKLESYFNYPYLENWGTISRLIFKTLELFEYCLTQFKNLDMTFNMNTLNCFYMKENEILDTLNLISDYICLGLKITNSSMLFNDKRRLRFHKNNIIKFVYDNFYEHDITLRENHIVPQVDNLELLKIWAYIYETYDIKFNVGNGINIMMYAEMNKNFSMISKRLDDIEKKICDIEDEIF